jgi:hypothetical protein
MGAVAVPHSTVASHPALPWVSTYTTPVRPLASQISSMTRNP